MAQPKYIYDDPTDIKVAIPTKTASGLSPKKIYNSIPIDDKDVTNKRSRYNNTDYQRVAKATDRHTYKEDSYYHKERQYHYSKNYNYSSDKDYHYSNRDRDSHHHPPQSSYRNEPRRQDIDHDKKYEISKQINSDICTASSRKQILHIIKNDLDFFSVINISTSVHRLRESKSHYDLTDSEVINSREYRKLIKKAEFHISEFSHQQLSNVLVGISSLHYDNSSFIQSLIHYVKKKVEGFNSLEIPHIISSLNKLDYQENDKFSLLSPLENAAILELENFYPKGIATFLVGCIMLNYRPVRFIEKIIEKFNNIKFSEKWSFPDIALSLWAITLAIGTEKPQTVHSFASSLIAMIPEMKVITHHLSELAKLLWSLAKLKYPDQSLFLDCIELITCNISMLTPLEIAHITFGYALLGIPSPRFFEKISEFNFQDFCPEALSLTAWSFGKMGLRKIPFFYHIEDIISLHFTDFLPYELAPILWSFSTLNIYPDRLLQSLVREIPSFKVSSWDISILTNWAFFLSFFSEFSPTFFEPFFDVINSKKPHFNLFSSSIIHPVLLSIKYESDLHLIIDKVDKSVLNSVQNTFQEYQINSSNFINNNQKTEVYDTLLKIFPESSIAKNHFLECGYLIDFFIPSISLAIHLSSENKELYLDDDTLIGQQILKHSLLKRLGIASIVISDFNFRKLSTEDKYSYIKLEIDRVNKHTK